MIRRNIDIQDQRLHPIAAQYLRMKLDPERPDQQELLQRTDVERIRTLNTAAKTRQRACNQREH